MRLCASNYCNCVSKVWHLERVISQGSPSRCIHYRSIVTTNDCVAVCARSVPCLWLGPLPHSDPLLPSSTTPLLCSPFCRDAEPYGLTCLRGFSACTALPPRHSRDGLGAPNSTAAAAVSNFQRHHRREFVDCAWRKSVSVGWYHAVGASGPSNTSMQGKQNSLDMALIMNQQRVQPCTAWACLAVS